jgi:hypothetical protein
MGQYHVIYNKTKKEYYSFGGAKLWEKAYSSVGMMGLLVLLCNSNNRGGGDLNNPIIEDDKKFVKGKLKKLKTPIYTDYDNKRRSKAEFDEIEFVLNAVQGRWSGDEIVIQGDYADERDPSYIKTEVLDTYKDITHLVVKAIQLCAGDDPEVKKTLEFERQFSRGRF